MNMWGFQAQILSSLYLTYITVYRYQVRKRRRECKGLIMVLRRLYAVCLFAPTPDCP